MKTANEWFIGLPQREDSVYEFKREEIIALLEDYSKELREEKEKLIKQFIRDGEEIQRLTKEVERLKERHSAQVGRAFEKTQEITRLQELLGSP